MFVPALGAMAMSPSSIIKATAVPAGGQPPIYTASAAQRTATELASPERERTRTLTLFPLWILLFVPYVLVFLMARQRGGITTAGYIFAMCAVAAGFYAAAVQRRTGAAFIAFGVLFSMVALAIYVIVGFGVLFVGCLVLVGAHR